MKNNSERFNMNRKPNKPPLYLRAVEFLIGPIYTYFNHGHIKTDPEVKRLKGPFLVLGSHASFMDFAQIATGLGGRANGWVVSIDEFRRGDWLMYGIGGIPKRKFTHGLSTAKHILKYLKEYQCPVVLFPEARFSLAGVNERLDEALGKLCKHANVPVVSFQSNGNYINSPQWGKRPYRKIRQEGRLSLLCSAEDVEKLSAEEIQERIEKEFVRDEYKWQVDHNLHIKCKKRAEGIHRILYKCPACNTEFETCSEGTKLWCEACGAKWEMDTLSRLHGVNTQAGFSHVPDWYNWEREEVRKEVQAGTYRFEDDVRVEDYYNSKTGFIPVGTAHVVHDENGFTFRGTVDGKPFELNKPVSSMYSCHIEYDFLKRGDAFDIATDLTTYFMYPQTAKNCLTKIHFATEELYDHYVRNKKEN